MAHYISEVIGRAEAAKGAQKATAERECFDVILQFWKHRASLPGSRRPLESFGPIFHTLAQLLQDSHIVIFERTEHRLDPASEKWLDLASGVDHAARDLIRWCIAQATSEAVKRDREWLESETARDLDDGDDLKVARMLVQDMKIFIRTSAQMPEQRAKDQMEIRKRLDAFVSTVKTLRAQIDDALGSQAVSHTTARKASKHRRRDLRN